MDDYGVTFERGFSLNEALAMLEDDEQLVENVKDVTIFPPENAASSLTDEDSGDEETFTLSNLPGSQLRAPAEIHLQIFDNNSNFSSEDDMPLDELQRMLPSTSKASVKRSSTASKSTKKKAKRQKVYDWTKDDLNFVPSTDFGEPSNLQNLDSPLETFSYFFDERLIDLIRIESNRYASQKNLVFRSIENFEIKSFIGVLILSGYVRLPRRRMYWERKSDTHNHLVSEAISRDRFEFILSNFHFVDNENLPTGDKFIKLRPLFDHLQKKFIQHAFIEETHSVDEAMVPYFGRHGCKQYIHGKPIRYGYKLWVGTTHLGYINWFEPYQGASTNISEKYAEYGVGAAVVLEYADVLQQKWPNQKFHLFFDNFFSTISLFEQLDSKNLRGTGTIRENRVIGNPLLDSKAMKKQKRGSYDYRKITDKNIIAVKWHDNNIVCLCSNCAGVQPIHFVKRYSQKEKKNIQVDQPHVVNMYNANMGGVDRSDQNISLYRISIRGKKWYFPLITHAIDMAVTNAWQIHRKNGGSLDQLGFRRQIATTLLSQNKKVPTYQKGRPSASRGADIRYDRIDHLIITQEKQTRCGYCHERAKARCSKCDIGLHTKCFAQYHTKS